MKNYEQKIFDKEKQFHDEWAHSVSPEDIDVILYNTACTLPEIRYVHKMLKNSNLRDVKLLDLGCGMGETSVYFAMQGADVVAADISAGMLGITQKVAQKYNVTLTTHKSTAENLNFTNGEQFDIVYAGFLMHHVNIEQTLCRLKEVMKPDATFICCEPIAYNPIINIYRKIATKVRTEDEHPLTKKDIKTMKKHFADVKTKYFWFFSLIIFVLMALTTNPNKVRYWKKMVEEKKWKYICRPLQFIDNIILFVFPFLKWFCWTVVIFAKKEKRI
jgi:ubiquinone/menaquinone biosynthesis C-methylase UbiE